MSFDALNSNRLFTLRTRDVGEVVCLPLVLKELRRAGPDLRLRDRPQWARRYAYGACRLPHRPRLGFYALLTRRRLSALLTAAWVRPRLSAAAGRGGS